jgi:hypothetical protein
VSAAWVGSVASSGTPAMSRTKTITKRSVGGRLLFVM